MGDEETLRVWMRALILKYKNAMKQILGVTFEKFSAIDDSEMYDELFEAVHYDYNDYKISKKTSRIKNRKSFKALLMSKLGMIVAFRRMLTHEEGKSSRSNTPAKEIRERSFSNSKKKEDAKPGETPSKVPYVKQRSEDCLSIISSVAEDNMTVSNAGSNDSKKTQGGLYVPKKYRNMEKKSSNAKTKSEKKKKSKGFLKKIGFSSSKNRERKTERKRYRKPSEEDTSFKKYMGKMKIKFGFGVKKKQKKGEKAKKGT